MVGLRVPIFGVAMLLAGFSQQVFGLADVQFSGGRRVVDQLKFLTSEADQRTGKAAASNEWCVAAHLNPFPLVPFGIGGFYLVSAGSYDVDRDVHYFEDFRGAEGGVEMTLWAPVEPIIPFVKAGYAIYGRYTASISEDGMMLTDSMPEEGAYGQSESKFTYRTNTLHVSVGMAWSPGPFVALFALGDFGMGRLQLEEARYGEEDVTDRVKDSDSFEQTPKFTSRAFMAGAEIGF